jgi:hypothetical protein
MNTTGWRPVWGDQPGFGFAHRDWLKFVHPIVREAVYADIGSHERAAAHGPCCRTA